MNVVLGGLISEAWARSVTSYSRSLEYYHNRTNDGLQPHTPYFDVFSVEQQNTFLCYANAAYLLITVALFVYMKRRTSGFRLRWILVLYDGSNVLIASYIAISILRYKLTHGGLLVCNTLANDPEGYRISWVFALFYAQKYYEFLDTWFFILRKSSRQVTFLHLFHHSSITVVVGSILPFDYNADMYLPILLNSANHTLLYLHYLLATLGLKSWWAPYITSMQLVQFIVIFAQSLLSYRVGPTCGSPDFAKVLMIVYMGSMIALFLNFFMQKYVFRRPVQALDMCGVVKRPQHLYSNVPSQYCGTAVLDVTGRCTVVLPDDFPDEERILRESLRHAPFCIVYSLTAMGCAMPSLHVSREVGRLAPPVVVPATTATTGGTQSPLAQSPSSSKLLQSPQHVKISPNSATALASARDKKKKNNSNNANNNTRDAASPAIPAPEGNQLNLSNQANRSRAERARADSDAGSSLFPDSAAFLADLPPAHHHGAWSSNSNVVKSASISDFRLLPSHNSFADSSRESSSGNLQQLLHNDRLIDGPLPLSESFKLINKYSQQFRSGISESIFRLTLGALAAEERGGGAHSSNSSRVEEDAAVAAVSSQSDTAAANTSNTHPEDGDESAGICGALSAADRAGSFGHSGGSFAAALNVYATPLSFSIAGGVPGATVSWVVHTAPIVPSANSTAAANQADAGVAKDVNSDGTVSGSPVSGSGKRKGSAMNHQHPHHHQVGSTGIIRSSSAVINAGAPLGPAHGAGNSSMNGPGNNSFNNGFSNGFNNGFGSSGSLGGLEEMVLSGQQHLLYSHNGAEDQQDYALDWRAIS